MDSKAMEKPEVPDESTAPQSKASKRRSWSLPQLVIFPVVLFITYLYLTRDKEVTSGSTGGLTRTDRPSDRQQASFQVNEVVGHGDFEDGRKTTTGKEFVIPPSEALHWVNVNLGNGGPEPNLSGGMIPAVAPPYAMTRWTPQTRQHYVSMCPYNETDSTISGFLGTHQPAVWMGESGPAQISIGLGGIETDFEKRALPFDKRNEYASANYYSNLLHAPGGDIFTELAASKSCIFNRVLTYPASRVGHMRFSFPSGHSSTPHVVLQASRKSALLSHWQTENPNGSNVTFPLGHVGIDRERQEVHGWNDERQE